MPKSVNSNALASLKQLDSLGQIAREDYTTARNAEKSAGTEITLGCELEIQAGTEGIFSYTPSELDTLLGSLHFGCGDDALYETQSPPSNHPFTQGILHTGLAQCSIIPSSIDRAEALPLHVSLGVDNKISEVRLKFVEWHNMARAVEWLGASTAERLLSPSQCRDTNDILPNPYTLWNCRGAAGICIDKGTMTWLGNSTRIEFRTPGYVDRDQMQVTLDALYYLSRGATAQAKTSAAKTYAEFRGWFTSCTKQYDLPTQHQALTYFQWENFWEHLTPADFETYMLPFARLVEPHTQKIPLQQDIAAFALKIRESLDMNATPTALTQVTS